MSDNETGRANTSPPKLRMVSNERGSVLALVALCLVMFLGLAALAIDLGLLHVARGEAQRAADAAAHAGAGYLWANPNATDEQIADEAIRIGQLNQVRGGSPDIERSDVQVLRDERKVRVSAHRTADRGNPVQTLFASALGFHTVDVAAIAAAQIWPADGVECLLPFVIPDRWWVGEEGGPFPEPGDVFDPDDDHYKSWNPDNPTDDFYSGYDAESKGVRIQLFTGSPNDAPQPGWWYPFSLQGTPDANRLEEAIKTCVDEEHYHFGDDLETYTAPGKMPQAVGRGFQYLMDQDPDLYWAGGPDTAPNCVLRRGDEEAGCVKQSARIRPAALFNPEDPPAQGFKPFTIMNFVGIFVEDVDPNPPNVSVTVRFMDYRGIDPAAEWHDGATTVMMLRIVE